MANVSKTMCIEMGHRLQHHQGKCKNLHGHSYKIEVFAEGDIITEGPSKGMVIDYAILKDAMQGIDLVFDHKMCLEDSDPLLDSLIYAWTDEAKKQLLNALKTQNFYCMAGRASQQYVLIAMPPTAEVLAGIWLKIVADYFGSSQMKFKIRVWETATSCCEVSIGELQA